jgi:peptide/nickel transport system substrate-binding protein
MQYGASGVAAAGVIGLIGCGDDDDEGAPSPTPGENGATPGATPDDGEYELADQQVLRTRFYFDLLPLDPARIFGIEQENAAIAVYSGLTRYNTGTEIEPDLAESWEQPDPTTYVFNLAAAEWQKGVWSCNR